MPSNKNRTPKVTGMTDVSFGVVFFRLYEIYKLVVIPQSLR